ncbi:MAG: hypothetical protein IOD15_15380 [Phycisphaerales bacterium]|nr:hypothetical protein [Phycisphaerales bacterium]
MSGTLPLIDLGGHGGHPLGTLPGGYAALLPTGRPAAAGPPPVAPAVVRGVEVTSWPVQRLAVASGHAVSRAVIASDIPARVGFVLRWPALTAAEAGLLRRWAREDVVAGGGGAGGGLRTVTVTDTDGRTLTVRATGELSVSGVAGGPRGVWACEMPVEEI